MPTYDYYCETNGQKVEVNHRMSEELTTWGEICERTGSDFGNTPKDAPVHKLATGGNIVASNRMGSGNAPPSSCGMGGGMGGCPSGMCGLH